MVRTIHINPSTRGIEFENGSLRMVGTKDKLDKDEKIQSLATRFLTQLGENSWAPDEGFDYQGVLSQIPLISDRDETGRTLVVDIEKIGEVNAIKTLAQDFEISRLIDYLKITKDRATKTATIDLTCHTIEGSELKGDFRLGGDFYV